jgi:biopolymer transport protein ExbD
MAMSVGGPRTGAIADINVTPMADVMIVLLIIFMVATPIIDVRPDDFALNSTPVLTLHDLDVKLRAAFETRGDATLFVRPSTDISYARLVAALDVAKGAGASRIGLVEESGP